MDSKPRPSELEILRELAKDPDFAINKASDDFKVTPLTSAVSRGNLAMVNALLELKADPNKEDEEHENPLEMAAGLGQVDIMHALISKAPINPASPNNQKLGCHVAIAGHVPVLEYLHKLSVPLDQ